MHDKLSARSEHTVTVQTEPDGTVSLSVGRHGIYLLASLTRQESLRVRRMLAAANRELGARTVEKRVRNNTP